MAHLLLILDAIVRQHGTAHSTMAGFLAAAETLGFEAVPLIFAGTDPCGLITAEAFDAIVGELIDLLRERGPWDGVLLANHGAAVAANYHDVDGEVARRVRAVVGPDVPIGIGLDLLGHVLGGEGLLDQLLRDLHRLRRRIEAGGRLLREREDEDQQAGAAARTM